MRALPSTRARSRLRRWSKVEIVGALLSGLALNTAAPSARASLSMATSMFAPVPLPDGVVPIMIATPSPASFTALAAPPDYALTFDEVAPDQGVVQGALLARYAIPVAGSVEPGMIGGTPLYLSG